MLRIVDDDLAGPCPALPRRSGLENFRQPFGFDGAFCVRAVHGTLPEAPCA